MNNTFYRLTPKHVRLLQERTQDSPTASCPHLRPPLLKVVITHGNPRDSVANPKPLSTNCFVYNIYPLSQTNIRSIQSQVRDRYNCYSSYTSVAVGPIGSLFPVWAIQAPT